MAASRENVWLQAALIVFVLISVILAATTWVYYTQARRQGELAQTNQGRATNEQKRADANSAAFSLTAHYVGDAPKTEGELQSYESMVATSGTPDLQGQVDRIKKTYQADMQSFASDFPEENRNYHALPEHLMGIIRERNAAVADARQQVALKDQELATVKETEQNKTTAAEKGRDEAIADRDDIKEQAAGERTRVNAEKETMATQMKQKDVQISTITKTAQDERSKLIAQIDQHLSNVAALQERLDEIEIGLAESADGQVTWIDQRSNAGYVNLGGADGLKPGTTFSVYDRNETRFGEDVTPKGSIEIVRVTGPKQAQFRVLSPDASDPILARDVIQSPVWNPGDKIGFALVGVLDVDGDGQSDHELVKNIIRSNNGAIDAEMTEQGDVVGTMTVKTRYLVMGDPPTDRSDKSILEGYTRMQSQADEYSIQRIDLQKLLDYMGYRSQATVTPLGSGSGGGSLDADGGGSAFRERRPPGGN